MAEAVTKGVEDLDKEITCPVCQEHFEDPKLLPCGHFYCKQCIDALAHQAGRGHPFPCPECRKTTRLPENNSNKLPSAFFVNRMKDIHSSMVKTRESDDPKKKPSTGHKPHKKHSKKLSKEDSPAAVSSDHYRQPGRGHRSHRNSTDGTSFNSPYRNQPPTNKHHLTTRDRDRHSQPHSSTGNPGIHGGASFNRSKSWHVSSKVHSPVAVTSVSRHYPILHSHHDSSGQKFRGQSPRGSPKRCTSLVSESSRKSHHHSPPSRSYQQVRDSSPSRSHHHIRDSPLSRSRDHIHDIPPSRSLHGSPPRSFYSVSSSSPKCLSLPEKKKESEDSWGTAVLAGAAIAGVGALAYGLYQLMKPTDSDSD